VSPFLTSERVENAGASALGAGHQGKNLVPRGDAAATQVRYVQCGQALENPGPADRHAFENSIAKRPRETRPRRRSYQTVPSRRRVVNSPFSSASEPCAPRVMAATRLPYSCWIISSALKGSLSLFQRAGNSELVLSCPTTAGPGRAVIVVSNPR